MHRLRTAAVACATFMVAAVGLAAQETQERADSGPPDIVVEVDGLSCPFCAYGVEKKFVEREEVDSVFVALGENEVHLWLKPSRSLPDDAVRETVEEAGFSSGAIRRPSTNRSLR